MIITILILTIINIIILIMIYSEVDYIKTTSNTIERLIYNLSDLIYYGKDNNNCKPITKDDSACRC